MKSAFYFIAFIFIFVYGMNSFLTRMRNIDTCIAEAKIQGLNIVKNKKGEDTSHVYLPGRSETTWCLDVRKVNGVWVAWDFTR